MDHRLETTGGVSAALGFSRGRARGGSAHAGGRRGSRETQEGGVVTHAHARARRARAHTHVTHTRARERERERRGGRALRRQDVGGHAV